MFKILIDTIRLDVFDLNYNLSSDKVNFLDVPLQSGLEHRGLLMRLAAFGYHIVKSISSVKFQRYRQLPDNHVIFAVFSENNYDALWPLHQRMTNSSFLSTKGESAIRIPMLGAYLLSIVFIPILIVRYMQQRGYRRKSFRIALDAYLETYGYYIVCRILIRRLAPAAIVVSNDHIYRARALCSAAQSEGVPTFYVQHASVNSDFPPLFFDYALLEGEDALISYTEAGSTDTKVYLVGIPKFDAFYHAINRSKKIQAIGICTNDFDGFNNVESLCIAIRKRLPELSLFLRSHPSDRRMAEWMLLADRVDARRSNPIDEMSYKFLSQIDLVIAGESNILLEAAILNVCPENYDFEMLNIDNYGFLRNGLIDKRHTNPDELIKTLNNKIASRPDVRHRTKFWCETVNTKYDGRSADLASTLITSIAAGEKIDMAIWEPIQNLENLRAYRPR